MSKIIWKDIIGYEGLYQASNLGIIKSLNREITCKDGRTRIVPGKYLKPYNHNGKYRKVSLSKKGKYKNLLVHRLVLESFGIDINSKYIVHMNNVRHDNRLSNLKAI